MATPQQPDAPVPAEVIEIERELHRIAYLSSRARQHDRMMALAGVPLDRAAVSLLRALADVEQLRVGELASRLNVEAPHVTRQAQRLERAGHVERVPDPDDGRAQLIRLTPAGRDAVDRIRETSRRGMWAALSHWDTEDLRRLADLFQRMVDDFLDYAAANEPQEPSRAAAGHDA
ncbi:MarR family winged helix-turn-helix transcriptional regulator [Streptomyces sp. NPDC127098]|uniref:MarR family winged helix-turn-helix transcriptional regulator n=1 Tax=Streptomyces sp. NPDC127098 TaxID=3347137 RepID=UPI003649126B